MLIPLLFKDETENTSFSFVKEECFKSDFDCLVEKTNDCNTFKIYIDNQLVFNLEDIFDDMNLDYILCRSRGSGHDFCNSKIDTMGKNEDRARRSNDAK